MELKAATSTDVLNADDLTRERVDCPEWGLYVYIRTMTIRQRSAWEQAVIAQQDEDERNNVPLNQRMDNAAAILLARCICDEAGKLLFSPEDAEALGNKSSAAMSRCFDVAARLNYLTDQHIEELVKNLSGAQNGSSGSA